MGNNVGTNVRNMGIVKIKFCEKHFKTFFFLIFKT